MGQQVSGHKATRFLFSPKAQTIIAKAIFLKLKDKKLAIRIMVALDLGAAFRAEIHEYPYWELGSAEIAESLVVLPFGELRDSFALDDDVANW